MQTNPKIKETLDILGRSALESSQKQKTLMKTILDLNPALAATRQTAFIQTIASTLSESARIQAEAMAEIAHLANRLQRLVADDVAVEFGDGELVSEVPALTRVMSEDSLVLPIMDDGFTIVASIASDSSDGDDEIWPIMDMS